MLKKQKQILLTLTLLGRADLGSVFGVPDGLRFGGIVCDLGSFEMHEFIHWRSVSDRQTELLLQ